MGFDWQATRPEAASSPSQLTDSPKPAGPKDEPEPSDSRDSTRPATKNESADTEGPAYQPNHPWHYYHLGDNAPPVPFDQIPASEGVAQTMVKDLPKAPAKRMVRVRELLESERRELDSTAARYRDVIERGAAALSDYDRNIAHGGNEDLARASTLAILYNRVAWHRGRLDWLETEAKRRGYLQR
jgi:hypothetical protein